MTEPKLLTHEEDLDFVEVLETQSDSSHDWLETVQVYALYQRNRVGRRGGGMCMYIKSDFTVNMKDNITNEVRKEV